MEAPLKYAKAHHPKLVERLSEVTSACSNFTGGCARAYELVHGAVHNDGYVNDCSVWFAKSKCKLKGCVDHMIPNCVDQGKTGRTKLEATVGHSKDEVADAMRARLDFSARRLNVVLFDIFWYFTLHELEVSGTIESIGKQIQWAAYFRKYYLFDEPVGGVQLLNAIWRNGPDRGLPRSSDNIAESYHSKVKNKLKSITKSLLQGQSANARPSLPALIPRMENAIEIDDQFNTRHKEKELHRVPVDVDPNLLTGHASIYRWTKRLAAKDFASAWRQDKSYIQRIESPPYHYFVMSSGRIRTPDQVQRGLEDNNRLPARTISEAKARQFVDFLTLQPQEDRQRPYLMASGFQVGDHLKGSAWTEVLRSHSSEGRHAVGTSMCRGSWRVDRRGSLHDSVRPVSQPLHMRALRYRALLFERSKVQSLPLFDRVGCKPRWTTGQTSPTHCR